MLTIISLRTLNILLVYFCCESPNSLILLRYCQEYVNKVTDNATSCSLMVEIVHELIQIFNPRDIMNVSAMQQQASWLISLNRTNQDVIDSEPQCAY